MRKQRGLFEGSEEEGEYVFRRLQEEVRIRVTELLADLALKQVKAIRKEARDERQS